VLIYEPFLKNNTQTIEQKHCTVGTLILTMLAGNMLCKPQQQTVDVHIFRARPRLGVTFIVIQTSVCMVDVVVQCVLHVGVLP